MQPIRYGLLSTSSIAPRFVAAVRAAGGGEVVALSSRSLEKAQAKAAEWNIPTAYGSHDQLLGDPNVDVIYLSTVNGQHYQWAKAALLAGKHVLCEKPCTTSSRQTRELFALARQRGLFLMEAQKMLFLPAVLALKERVERGDVGKIHLAEFRHSFSPDYNGWMFRRADGGGTLLSSGIYVMELLLWLFGPLETCSGVWTPSLEGGECQYMLAGRMENGVLFTAANSTKAMFQDGARFYGERGFIDLPLYWKARTLTIHANGREPETLEFPCDHELVYEVRHVQACLSENRLTSPVVTEELSVAAMEAIEEIYRNWR